LVVSCQMLVIIKMIINICHLTDIVLYKLEVFVIYQANI